MPPRGARSTRKRTRAASIDGGWGPKEEAECLREVLGARERGPWQPQSMGGGVQKRSLSASARCSEHAKEDPGSLDRWGGRVDWRTLSASTRCSEHSKEDPGSLNRWGVGSKRGP